MTHIDATDQAWVGDPERSIWSATLDVTSRGEPTPARVLRRLARGHADFANALFTVATGPDDAAQVVLVADDEPTLDRLVDRLRVLGAGDLQLELVLVDRSGPGVD